MVFIHPRTGRSWATEAMAIEMDGPLVSPPGSVTLGLYAGEEYAGQTQPIQTGSQYWMNSNYTGPEPDYATKMQYSDAGYARDYVLQLLKGYPTNTLSAPVAAEQGQYSNLAAAGTGLFAGGTGSDVIDQSVSWIQNNILLVIIAIAAVFVLPRLLDAALPSGRRR